MAHDEVTESLIHRIQRTLSRTDTSFHLFFILVNLPETRKVISKKLIKQLQRPVIELSVSRNTLRDTTLDGWLLPQLETAPKNGVVFLYNLQECLPTGKKDLHHTLQQLNWRRSSLAAIQRPLVIWMPRYAIDNLAEYAPDFYDWYSNVYEFIPSAEDLQQEKNRFKREFTKNGVFPARRMSNADKQEWLHTLNALLADTPGHNAYRAELLSNSGTLHEAIGNLDDALEQYQKALTIVQEIGERDGEGAIYNNISQIYHTRGDYDKALSLLNKSLNIRRKTKNKAGEGATLGNISQIYKARGNYDKALLFLNKSLKIQQEIGDIIGEGTSLNNISTIHSARGDYDKALSFLNKSLNIQQKFGDLAGEGTSLNNISMIYSARGDYDKALSFLNKALSIQRRISDISGKGTTLNNISTIYSARGDYNKALSFLNKALNIMQKIGDLAGICATLSNIGHIHWQNEEKKEAMDTWLKAFLLAKKLKDTQTLQTLENLTKRLYLEDGLDVWQALADKVDKKEQSISG